jgi:ribosomal subunit interface protein
MNAQFNLNNAELDDATRAYIVRKVESIERLLDDVQRVEIEVSEEKYDKYRVEVSLFTPQHTYRSEETAVSFQAAADIVEDELKEQVRHEKERQTTMERRGARSIKKKLTIDESARL